MMKEFFHPQEYQRFLEQGAPPQSLHHQGPHAAPVIPERPFQNFFGGFKEGLPSLDAPQQYNVNISAEEGERISSRSHVLSKQLSDDAAFAENQVDGLLSSLNIEHRPHVHDGGKYGNWMQNSNSNSLSHSNKSKGWSESFLERESKGEGWANDFAGQRSNQWAQGFHEELLQEKPGSAQEWAGEFQRKEAADVTRDDLKALREQIVSKNDEKLNGSQFMNYFKAYTEGEKESAAPTSFASEFAEQQRTEKSGANQGSYADQFVRNAYAEEFTGRERGWIDDYHKEHDDFDLDDLTAEEMERKWEKFRGASGAWAEQYLNMHEGAMVEDYERVFNMSRGQPDSDVYVFQATNPYLGAADALEQGLQLFEEGALPEAIQALEAAVQQEPTNSHAWTHLGKAHAENDKDKLAILALEQAVAVDHSNLDALMALAVSLTNEYEPDKTADALVHWLSENKKFQHLVQAKHDTTSPTTRAERLFVEAARMADDPDVHIALGLLFNLSFEYQKATECFKAALRQRPDDYALWNKYGATIANSHEGRSAVQTAIDAYFHALDKKPSFTRARSNLGISYMSAKNYVEAAKCFLGALTINNSQHLWDSARSAFLQLGREDLAEKCNLGDVRLFRNEFDF